MTMRTVALFVHLLGATTLFSAMAIQHRAAARLIASENSDQARSWLGLLLPTRAMFYSALVMIFATGAYLSGGIPAPWIAVPAASTAIIAVLFGLLSARHLSAMDSASQNSPSTLLSLAAVRAPWIALAAINGATIGLLWIMAARPDVVESLAAAIVPATVGGIVGSLLVKRPHPSRTQR